MKNWILFFIAFVPSFLFAQTEGMIKYTETISLDIELPEGMEEFAVQIPSSQKMKHVMYFDEASAIYKNDADSKNKETVEGGSEEGGMQFRMDFEMPENVVFCDLKEGKTVQKQEFMGKIFLIDGEIKKS